MGRANHRRVGRRCHGGGHWPLEKALADRGSLAARYSSHVGLFVPGVATPSLNRQSIPSGELLHFHAAAAATVETLGRRHPQNPRKLADEFVIVVVVVVFIICESTFVLFFFCFFLWGRGETRGIRGIRGIRRIRTASPECAARRRRDLSTRRRVGLFVWSAVPESEMLFVRLKVFGPTLARLIDGIDDEATIERFLTKAAVGRFI